MRISKYFCFIFFCVFVIASTLCVCDALFFYQSDNFLNEEVISNGIEKVQILFYEGLPQKSAQVRKYPLKEPKELMKSIDKEKPTVLYIHGFEEHPSNESVQTIVSAYTQRGSDNILVLDWSPIAFENYIVVTARTKSISKYTAQALQDLVSTGLNASTLHIIGHSLGAHIAGFIGRYLNFTIPRITALDPANPLFYQFGADHINSKSGKQVDIIHTDGGLYGAYGETGTVDFFANGGNRPQPGCALFGKPLSPRDFCSHWRSWRFYAESVINNTAFPAVACKSYATFIRDGCKDNPVIYYGYATSKNISGRYYFMTNDKYPFGRGLMGIRGRQ